MTKRRRKPSKTEDRVLMVYHSWLIYGSRSDTFSICLNGLFEMLKEEFPKQTLEAFVDARVRLLNEQKEH